MGFRRAVHCVGIASTDKTLIECWRQPMEAKMFFVLALGDTKVAVVCGFFLRVYDVSEGAVSLVSQIRVGGWGPYEA